jgi:asparagine synthase (glutamine-hydrolysing)
LEGFDAQEYLREIAAPMTPAGSDYAPSLDARWRMVDYILTRTDKLSMAASLEVRVPFLDHRVVELLAQVPARHKIHGLESKRLLREVARPLLPDSITQRRKKPFGAPVDHWLPPLAQRYLTDSALVRDGILDAQSVAQHIQAGLSQPDAQGKLWMLVVLDLWYRIFIQRDPALLEQVADRSLVQL